MNISTCKVQSVISQTVTRMVWCEDLRLYPKIKYNNSIDNNNQTYLQLQGIRI